MKPPYDDWEIYCSNSVTPEDVERFKKAIQDLYDRGLATEKKRGAGTPAALPGQEPTPLADE